MKAAPGSLRCFSSTESSSAGTIHHRVAVTSSAGASSAAGSGGAVPVTASGIGFVHNGRLIDHPQKSVVWAPFRQFPKPPWFVSHRSTNRAMKLFAEFETDPGLVRLLKVGAASLRG